MRDFIILRGLPGNGKSSLAKLICEENAIFEADNFFYNENGEYVFDVNKLNEAHKECFNGVKTAMAKSVNKIVLSNTSTTEKELKPYLELAKEFNYRVFSVIVENRHGNKSIHDVPEETITKMVNRFNVKLR
jgi:predicted kinase